MHRLLGGVALVLGLAVARDAGAISACSNGEGWGLAPGSKVTAHPQLTYYMDARGRAPSTPPTVKATLDGKPVKVTVTFAQVSPYQLATIVVDSDRAGKLELTWQEPADHSWSARDPKASYRIDPKLVLGKEAKATATRYHQAYRHSTVHELDDGLAVAVDQPAVAFTARWRLDDKAQWSTIELAAITIDGHQVARLGSLGCASNFQTAILEHGIDLELTAKLVDGSAVKVTGLPAHYTLPALPPNAPQSQP